MQIIEINTPSLKSIVYVGEGAFDKYAKEISGNKFVITDSNVYKLYFRLIESAFPGAPVYVFTAGERSKNKDTLFKILDKMITAGATRKTTVIALGGGVVGDVAGLAAALYMRGVELVQIPTTLLSQVDSSVGGKTAVDYKGVKNVIGAFYQPSMVIVDPVFLKTLPKRELKCGLGEIVKYGALDCGIYNKLQQNSVRLFDLQFLEGITAECIRHKAKVVTEDERDISGARKALNVGHTTGHAFELYYRRKSHGEYVLIGMYYELYLAEMAGLCGRAYADSLRRLICKVIGKVPCYEDADRAALIAKYDKKNAEQTSVSMMVPADIGRCTEYVLPLDEYAKKIAECAEQLKAVR